MNNHHLSRRFRLRLASLMVVLLAAFILLPAHAQRANKDDDKAPPPSVGQKTGEVLNQAIGFLNMNDYASAISIIGTLNMEKLSPFEHSKVEQILFGISLAQEKYDDARKHIRAAIAAGGLNPQEVDKLKFTIAKLYILQENYKEGAAALEEWFKTALEPNSAAYYLLAAAYYQQGELDKAIAPAKKAVELGGDTPNPAWLTMLSALYVEKEDYKDAIPVVKRLIELEPKKKSHWVSLSSMYQQVDDYDRSLAVMQIAYNAGLLDQGSEFRRVADMAGFNGLPARCARIIEKAFDNKEIKADSDNYQRLSQCYVNAREFEKSLAPLTRAASLSDNGDLYVRMAQVQAQRKEWGAVVDALKMAMDKGDLKEPHFAEYLMGTALYFDSKSKQARSWFVRAEKGKDQRDAAKKFIQRIDYEAERAKEKAEEGA